MKLIYISIAILFFQHEVFAQQLQQRNENPVDLDSINIDTYYSKEEGVLVDEMPEFKGKDADFNRYISTHLVYPEEAYNRFIEGTVYVSYVIDTKGKVKDVTIIQSPNSILDIAAVTVVAHSPKWKPARYKGKPVPFKKMAKVVFIR